MPGRQRVADWCRVAVPPGRADRFRVRRTADIAQGANAREGTEQRKPKKPETKAEGTSGRPLGVGASVIRQFSQYVRSPPMGRAEALEVGGGDANAMAGVS